MVLEQKARISTVRIVKNVNVVPTGDSADTGHTGVVLLPRRSASTTATIGSAIESIDHSNTGGNEDAVRPPLPGHTAAAAAPTAASDRCNAASSTIIESSPSTLPAIEAISFAPQPAVVAAKASEEELLQEQNRHSDDEDEWDKLPVSSDVNADSNLPMPPEEDTATLVVSKQPFLPLPPRSTPIMSPRMSKKTMMSPSRASFSLFERVPVIPPPVSTNDTSNSSGISAQSTPAYSIRQIAQIYRNRGLPAQARPVTLEDYDVNSKARFIIS